MKKRIWTAVLAAALLLPGCSSLLERSYSVVEPYADSYWDAEEDFLRAESYQELVNSLLMLVEERSQEGTIRFYTSAAAPYSRVVEAAREVREETALGSYLVEDLTFLYQGAEDHCTLTWTITYREEAEDPDSLMTLSDAQSLVDLLRLAVREEHDRITARFSYDVSRQEAIDAAGQLWQELCAAQLPPGEESPAAGTEAAEEESPPEDGEARPEDGADQEEAPAEGEEAPAEPEMVYPPCPWEIRFYPDRETAEIVEILLTDLPAVPEGVPEGEE